MRNPGDDHGRLERQDGLQSALQQLSGELGRLGLQLAATVTVIWVEATYAFEHSIQELVCTLAARRRPRDRSGHARWEHWVRQTIWSLPTRAAHRTLRRAQSWRRAASRWDLRLSLTTAGPMIRGR